MHAEANAILNLTTRNAEGATLYCVWCPCHECTQLILQMGIKRVVFLYEKTHKEWSKAARRMFEAAGVELDQLDIDVDRLRLTI